MSLSYEILGKDIKLKYVNYGQYDREWLGQDFVTVSDMDALDAGIKVKLLTVFGELGYNPTYAQFGNRTWFLMKQNLNKLTITQVKSYTQTALSEMYRIATVDLVTATPAVEVDPGGVDVFYSVTTIDDRKLSGGISIGTTS